MRTVCECISPHLVANANVVVEPKHKPISPRKRISHGVKFYDGGHMTLSFEEAETALTEHPELAPYIRKMINGRQMLYGIEDSYCLFLNGYPESILSIPLVAERLRRRDAFLRSSAAGCAKDFMERLKANPQCQMFYVYPEAEQCIAIPATMTVRRTHIPMIFVDGAIVINASMYVVLNGDEADFAVLSSKMHMLWVKAVAGRIEHNLRYSPAPVYNTFPWPLLTPESSRMLAEFGQQLLEARKQDGRCLAKQYDPDRMPEALRDVHSRIDSFIERLYCPDGFRTDADRLSCLLRMYAEQTRTESLTGIDQWC